MRQPKNTVRVSGNGKSCQRACDARRWICVLFLWTVPGLSFSASAQDEIVPVKRFDRNNGLPAKVVYNLCKDNDGFIWFAAENGVFRFDGRNYYGYTTKDGLCDNEIIEIYADKKNNIWCSGYNGRISVIQNGVVNNDHNFIRDWKPGGFIYDITGDDAGNVFLIGEREELFRIDSLFRLSSLVPAVPWRSRGMIYNENLHLKFRDTLYTLDALGKCRKKIDSLPFAKHVAPNMVSRADGSFWVVTLNRRIRNLVDDTEINLESLGVFSPMFVSRVDYRYVVIGSWEGRYVLYDWVREHFWEIRLPEKARVVDALRDRQGNIWLSAYGDGLFIIRPETGNERERQTFRQFGRNIREAYRWNDELLAVNSTQRLLSLKNGVYTETPLPFLKKYADYNEYAAFIPLGNRLFLQTSFACFIREENGIMHGMELGGKEAVLYADSLIFIRYAYDVWLRPVRKPDSLAVVYPDRVFSFCLQGDKLWMGGKDGLICHDIRTQTNTLTDFHVPDNGRIEDMESLGDRTLILASSNSGVLFVHDGRFVGRISIENGLFDNDCKELDFCSRGWVVRHPLGLSLVDTVSGEISTVSRWKGIPVSLVNSVYIKDDEVLLSTNEGLFSTDVRALFAKAPEYRRVRLLRVIAGGKTVVPDGVNVPYGNNRLKVDFGLPVYNEPHLVQYYWRINGGEWNLTDVNSLELADLRTGEHRLEFKAKAPGFDFSPVTVMTFGVETPFWKSWAFLLGTGAVLLLIIVGVQRRMYRKRLARVQEKASIRHQLITFEQKALNAMMNPHFVFNAMGSIQYLLNRGEIQSANDCLVKFSRLIRKTLETSQKEYCYLDDEIERLTLYLQLEKMRLGDRMDFRISVSENLDPERNRIPTMILQTYVENAIIHGAAAVRRHTFISVTFRGEGDRLHITVEDNGPGFDLGNRSRGRFGLQATEKRLELLTQITRERHSVTVASPVPGSDIGTRVLLEFPLGKLSADV